MSPKPSDADRVAGANPFMVPPQLRNPIQGTFNGLGVKPNDDPLARWSRGEPVAAEEPGAGAAPGEGEEPGPAE